MVFGTTILGSNPSAPTIYMLEKIKKFLKQTDLFLYRQFGSEKTIKILQNIKEAKIIFDILNENENRNTVRFVGGCVRKSLCGENIDDIDLATLF